MPTKEYQADLLKRLENSQYAAIYLKAAFDETLSDNNTEAFLLALKNVVAAKNATHTVVKNRNLEQWLDRILQEEENPSLGTLTSVLQAVGLTIDFKPVSMEDTLKVI